MPSRGPEPQRGDVYMADLEPVVGHEQGGRRPFLIVSIDPMNKSAARMAIGVPLTTTNRGTLMHVRLDPPEGGLNRVSFATPEMVRSVSTSRLRRRVGYASTDTVDAIASRVGVLVGLGRAR